MTWPIGRGKKIGPAPGTVDGDEPDSGCCLKIDASRNSNAESTDSRARLMHAGSVECCSSVKYKSLSGGSALCTVLSVMPRVSWHC